MTNRGKELICLYSYDPIDRLVGTVSVGGAKLSRFYCNSRLVTENQGTVQRSIFQHSDQPLAQQNRMGAAVEVALLASDQMRSVLQTLGANQSCQIFYSPYGYRSVKNGLLSLAGFNGERSDPVTGYYFLGNGYRAFSPVLMRFIKPDNLSPFGMGGLNPYAYCLGDPINRFDDNGHYSWLKILRSIFSGRKRAKPNAGVRKTNVEDLLSSFKKTDTENTTPSILTNDLEFYIDGEISALISNEETLGRSLATKVSSGEGFKRMESGYSYKYILTDRNEFVIGGNPAEPNKPAGFYLSHPAMTERTTTRNVISAGYIRKRSIADLYTLNNHTGHYRSARDALQYAGSFIRRLGGKVEYRYY